MFNLTKTREERIAESNDMYEFKKNYVEQRNELRKNLEPRNDDNKYRWILSSNIVGLDDRASTVANFLTLFFRQGLKISAAGNCVLPTNVQQKVLAHWVTSYFSDEEKYQMRKAIIDANPTLDASDITSLLEKEIENSERPSLTDYFLTVCEKLVNNSVFVNCDNAKFEIIGKVSQVESQVKRDYFYLNFHTPDNTNVVALSNSLVNL